MKTRKVEQPLGEIMAGTHSIGCAYGKRCPCRDVKQTPTPRLWKLERSNDGQLCITSQGVVLAHVKDYAEERGRLIAAAPELLAVCKSLLAAYSIERAKLIANEISKYDAQLAVSLKQVARAIIAKAEGL